MTDPISDDAVRRLVEEIRAESERLSGRSLDRGCVDSGIASNLADKAAAAIDHLREKIAQKEEQNDKARRTISARDRRIARLVEAMEFARSRGVRFPADDEPPVVLSEEQGEWRPFPEFGLPDGIGADDLVEVRHLIPIQIWRAARVRKYREDFANPIEFRLSRAALQPTETPAPRSGAGEPVVKALEWKSNGYSARAELYRIEDNGPNWTADRFWLSFNSSRIGKFATFFEASAAAQSHYERRIRSALSTAPEPAQEPRHD